MPAILKPRLLLLLASCDIWPVDSNNAARKSNTDKLHQNPSIDHVDLQSF